MIALDGEFMRADVGGAIHPVPADERTPFAVAVWFAPGIEAEVPAGTGYEGLCETIDARLPEGSASCALRVDGAFELVRARSVPRQSPPYRPLTEVVAKQSVFELRDVEGTMVGFRFPDHSDGIEVGGYHLHFVTADRARGGHVLDCRIGPGAARAAIDLETELHVELPPGVELDAPQLDGELGAALDRVERRG
jgi:acetolactate decarboxylase